MSGSPGARAIYAFKIEDIFLVASECWVARENNQTAQMPAIAYGHQSAIEKNVLFQERTSATDGSKVNVIRYFITASVRVLKAEVSISDREPTDDELLAFMKLTFAADYSCSKEALEDLEAIGAFSRNAHFHTWPYVREEVSAFCGRLRIPRITLPMMKPDQTATHPSARSENQKAE
jgi:hypothetical protein